MLGEIVLDPSDENVASPDSLEVTSELGFLKVLNSFNKLFIRGQFLCNWVNEVARARGWHVTWLSSPSLEFRQACPTLSEEQAKTFMSRIGSLAGVSRPISLLNVGIVRWPEIDPLGKSEAEQAWCWLLWQVQSEFEPDEQVFVASLANSRLASETSVLKAAYTASSAEQAWQFIKEWLRCDISSVNFPACPAEMLPTWVKKRLQDEWKLRAVQTRGMFFTEIVNNGAQRAILQAVAGVTFAYYRNNPEYLSPEVLKGIKPYVSFREWLSLQELLPPLDPGSPPASVPELFSWFSNEYLTYRLRGGATPASLDRVRDLGREFGLWYLKFYSNARTGGMGSNLMSWSRTAELAREPGYVNLLIVLDGLGYIDAQQIIEFISAETSRLALDDLGLLFAPLPTVTHFAKPALLAGVTPVQAFEEEDIGPVETRDPAVIGALSEADTGSLIIWSLLEPDKTYHKLLDVQTLRHEVSGRLQAIARRILRIVNEVDDSQRLRVFVTTDHGRLLSNSNRVCTVPKNMRAHGRAAWGHVSAPFDSDGIYVDGALAYIDAARFGLPETAAIILSDDAFLTIDGRTGTASFPHGGIFPEEVLIPWVQFTRDRGPIAISVSVTGKGIAGASGRLRMEVFNTSDLGIEIVQLALLPMNLQIDTNLKLGPFRKDTEEWSVTTWPQKKDLASVKAVLTYVLPTGERQTVEVIPVLTTDEMYSRETILDDLF